MLSFNLKNFQYIYYKLKLHTRNLGNVHLEHRNKLEKKAMMMQKFCISCYLLKCPIIVVVICFTAPGRPNKAF